MGRREPSGSYYCLFLHTSCIFEQKCNSYLNWKLIDSIINYKKKLLALILSLKVN